MQHWALETEQRQRKQNKDTKQNKTNNNINIKYQIKALKTKKMSSTDLTEVNHVVAKKKHVLLF
jgi:hypothetical protein